MTTEIIIKDNSAELGTGLLATTTHDILLLSATEIHSAKQRAVKIWEVVSDKLYENGGFENPSQWAEKYIGVNKSTLSRIIKAVNAFYHQPHIDENGNPIDTPFNYWEEFTLSQLFEMSSASIEKIIRCNITPEMTCAKIREALKRDGEMIDVKPSTDETTNPDETPDNNSEVSIPKPEETPEEVKETKDITVVCATVRHYKKCVVEYCEETDSYFIAPIEE